MPLEAKVLSKADGKVTLERASDGKTFTLAVGRLSEGDQKFLKKWAKQQPKNSRSQRDGKEKKGLTVHPDPPRIELKVNSNKKTEKTRIDYDDKRLSVKFVLMLKSLERSQALERLQVTCISFGRGVVDNKSLMVLSRDDHTTDLAAHSEVELVGERAETMYDNRGTYSKKGYSYLGHLVLIRDAEGQLIYSEGSPSYLVEKPAEALKLNAGKITDRTLK